MAPKTFIVGYPVCKAKLAPEKAGRAGQSSRTILLVVGRACLNWTQGAIQIKNTAAHAFWSRAGGSCPQTRGYLSRGGVLTTAFLLLARSSRWESSNRHELSTTAIHRADGRRAKTFRGANLAPMRNGNSEDED